jgi:hypothetical protein
MSWTAAVGLALVPLVFIGIKKLASFIGRRLPNGKIKRLLFAQLWELGPEDSGKDERGVERRGPE